MVGIDIVDLRDTKINTKTKRALKLIKNPNDQLIEHPRIFWILWATKEGIFKCEREHKKFSPTSISVQIHQEDDAITLSSGKFTGKVEITEEYVLTICSEDLDQTQYEVIQKDEEKTNDSIRSEIEAYFKNLDENAVIGSDHLNLPILLPSKKPISITHHGRFGAFAYLTHNTK